MLIFEHILEKLWSECLKFRTVPLFFIIKDEALEPHIRASPFSFAGFSFLRIYANPVYPISDLLMARPRAASSDANYCIKNSTPNWTHAIMNAESPRFIVGIASVCPFVYQRIHTSPLLCFLISR